MKHKLCFVPENITGDYQNISSYVETETQINHEVITNIEVSLQKNG